MRGLSAELKAHLAGEVTTTCTCWRVTRQVDGTAFYFTDHDQDIVFEGNTYVAAIGYQRTAMTSNTDFAVDNLDLQGIFAAESLTAADLRSGLFDFSDCRLFLVNWADLTQGKMTLRRAWFGDVQVAPSGGFSTTLNGLSQILTQNVGDLYTPTCRVDLGSRGFGQCNVDLAGGGWTKSATVTSVTNSQSFAIDVTEPRAVDTWFAKGVVTWTGGANNGRSIEVKTWIQTGSLVGLFLPMPNPITVGDTLTIYPGCDKLIPHCRDKFNNIVNRQAEDYVPGTDYINQAPPVLQ